MTDERRVEVAVEADDAHYIVGFGMETRCICGEWSYYPDESSFDLHRVRAVVAALDAHDGDLRERLAGAVKAMGHGDYFHDSAWPQSDAGDYCGRCDDAEEAARIVREVEL